VVSLARPFVTMNAMVLMKWVSTVDLLVTVGDVLGQSSPETIDTVSIVETVLATFIKYFASLVIFFASRFL